jgi:segregation and condensation protein B
VLKQLLTRDLLRIVGRKDEPGRPFLYGTTHEFLSFFGLASLAELPSLRDVSELAREQVEASKVPSADTPLPSEDGAGEAATEAAPSGDAAAAAAATAANGEEGSEDEDLDLLPEVEEVDEGDDELLEALTEATDAARGAERIKRSLRKMAAEQAEGVAPGSEAGKMLSSLADVVAARRRRKKKAQAPSEDEVAQTRQMHDSAEAQQAAGTDGAAGDSPAAQAAPGQDVENEDA